MKYQRAWKCQTLKLWWNSAASVLNYSSEAQLTTAIQFWTASCRINNHRQQCWRSAHTLSSAPLHLLAIFSTLPPKDGAANSSVAENYTLHSPARVAATAAAAAAQWRWRQKEDVWMCSTVAEEEVCPYVCWLRFSVWGRFETTKASIARLCSEVASFLKRQTALVLQSPDNCQVVLDLLLSTTSLKPFSTKKQFYFGKKKVIFKIPLLFLLCCFLLTVYHWLYLSIYHQALKEETQETDE